MYRTASSGSIVIDSRFARVGSGSLRGGEVPSTVPSQPVTESPNQRPIVAKVRWFIDGPSQHGPHQPTWASFVGFRCVAVGLKCPGASPAWGQTSPTRASDRLRTPWLDSPP